MTTNKYKLVMVRWYDAEHPQPAWTTKVDLDKDPDLYVETCGHLIYLDEWKVMVAVSLTGYGKEGSEQYGGIMTIPTCCITEIHEVIETKKKVKF